MVRRRWAQEITEMEARLAKTTDEQDAMYLTRQITWMRETRASVIVSAKQGNADWRGTAKTQMDALIEDTLKQYDAAGLLLRKEGIINELTAAQQALKDKHGTPKEFHAACMTGVDQYMISEDEALAAVEKYRQEWDEAGKQP